MYRAQTHGALWLLLHLLSSVVYNVRKLSIIQTVSVYGLLQVDLLVRYEISNVAVMSPDSSVSGYKVTYSAAELAPADSSLWTQYAATFTVIRICSFYNIYVALIVFITL